MKYHIIASRQIKECRDTACRAKYGQYDSLPEAEAALIRIKGEGPVDTTKEPSTTEFKKIKLVLPESNEETAETTEDVFEEAEEVQDLLASAEELAPVGEQEAAPVDFLDDDRAFLKGDDAILSVDKEAALIKQMENVISWKLENFYDEEGKRRGKWSLRNDPPILRIENSTGEQVEFVLTQHLTTTLAETFDTVKRGYFNLDGKRKDSLTQQEAKGKIAETVDWFSANPVKGALTLIVLVLCVITAFLM